MGMLYVLEFCILYVPTSGDSSMPLVNIGNIRWSRSIDNAKYEYVYSEFMYCYKVILTDCADPVASRPKAPMSWTSRTLGSCV
jgi:hypothetical protein